MNNTLILVGRVSIKPYVKVYEDGNKLVKFAIAVKEFGLDAKETGTMFVNVDARNGLGDRVLEFVNVGREVVLQGRLAINEEPKQIDGETVKLKYPFMKLKEIHFCGPKPNGEEKPKESKTKSRKKDS
jgi:single-stranded DNA-binding protein